VQAAPATARPASSVVPNAPAPPASRKRRSNLIALPSSASSLQA